MPGRHAHFARTNSFHPLGYSTSSAATLSGPFTPPSLFNGGLPGPTPYVPRRRSYTDSWARKPRAHTLISTSRSPLLNYDISIHPSLIPTHYLGISTAALCEPAVYPPQYSITLVTPHLPWSMAVSATNGRYVTVADVINTIYRALRVNVTHREFNFFGTPKLKRRATAAYVQRYERLRGHRGWAEERSQGVKRVDFLMGCTKFRGISPTPGELQVLLYAKRTFGISIM
ncbi:hypothetical protein C8J57DRAFT_1459029 [Mycena rebaudengoi]|nr:hypothetical protein C8J57DRAFT_1459029 [Mycena rebaudengoi]